MHWPPGSSEAVRCPATGWHGPLVRIAQMPAMRSVGTSSPLYVPSPHLKTGALIENGGTTSSQTSACSQSPQAPFTPRASYGLVGESGTPHPGPVSLRNEPPDGSLGSSRLGMVTYSGRTRLVQLRGFIVAWKVSAVCTERPQSEEFLFANITWKAVDLCWTFGQTIT